MPSDSILSALFVANVVESRSKDPLNCKLLLAAMMRLDITRISHPAGRLLTAPRV
jgi:hypothetical protein